MAQKQPHIEWISEDDYLRFEAASPTKHEFWNGRIVAMAGAPRRHNILAGNTLTQLNMGLRETPCVPTTGDLRVRLDESQSYVYPDVVVSCEDARFLDKNEMNLLNPRLIAEVLSPSTQNRDRGIKLQTYKQIPELLDYLIIEQKRVYIEHYRRMDADNWQYLTYSRRDQSVKLALFDLEIAVDEIYRRVDVPEQLILWDENEENDENTGESDEFTSENGENTLV